MLSQDPGELFQQYFHRQQHLVKKLDQEILPRQSDRILQLIWIDTPLTYGSPRFGASETRLAEGRRRGYQVNLNQDLQQVPDYVLDWVLWREALLGLLLPHLREIPEIADLGLHAGLLYSNFSNSQREALAELWKRVSPIQHHQYYIYNASFGFPLFDQVVEGRFLQMIIPWLNTLRLTTGIPFTSHAYTSALERWMLETHIPLTQPEHRILTALSQLNTPLHQAKLSEQLGMTVSGLSQHLTRLAQRHLLRLNHFINLPLIGLIPQEIIFRVQQPRVLPQLLSIFSKMPYIYSVHTIGPNLIHCRVLIPYNEQSGFEFWLNEIISQENLSLIISSPDIEIISQWNFNDYTPECGWPLDSTLILNKIQVLMENSSGEPASEFPRAIYSFNLLRANSSFPIKLAKADFTYFRRADDIVQITDRVSSQYSREILEAGISETAHMRYRRRVRTLEKQGISRIQGVKLLHIGLNCVVKIYLFELQEITESVVQTLLLLPHINAIILENGNGIIFAFIPNEWAVDLLSTLRKLFAENEINASLDVKPAWQSYRGFQSPLNPTLYDFNTGNWKWEQPKP